MNRVMMVSTLWNRVPPEEVARNQAGGHAPLRKAHTPGGRRVDLFSYIINGSAALLIPAIQEQTGMGFDSWWMRGALSVWLSSLVFVALRKPLVFHQRGLRMILISTVLFICGIINFELQQVYTLLPAIIDIGMILASQDIPEDRTNPIIPYQTQDIVNGSSGSPAA
ncbi:hypothetical protein BKA64DRAFT_640204 [Cadophora sp. MPI-SDFR-AT-0126]|nr:hypothetical protein BKA64DRAFT_640204 [Leotiomycetes sp. MPI-SDFR-AT-0126]